jgi:hypothetical protein
MENPMRATIALSLMLALVACGTPQEQCIARETRDLRVVDRLIKETQGNLQRGYAIEEVTIERTVWVDCTPRVPEGEPAPKPKLCLDDVSDTITRPKAIDLAAEQRKLDSLLIKRRELAQAAERVIAACKEAYPEE